MEWMARHEPENIRAVQNHIWLLAYCDYQQKIKPIKMDGNNEGQIHTDKENAIKQFQSEFTRKYPFLKLEVVKNDVLKSQLKITSQNDIQPDFNKNWFICATKINLGMERTVAEVGTDFNSLFDLLIQIFRKSGNVWVETSLTEDWTLEHQNKQGEQISALLK